jgi:8-oxo-dGTP diphosphatase
MQERYHVIPRNLIFLFYKDEVLLIKHNSEEKIGFGKWNGIGGHIEEGEDPRQAAIRETKEESGLDIQKFNLEFITIIPEDSHFGICLFIFTANSRTKRINESAEGQLMWVKVCQLAQYPLMEDLQIILELILKRKHKKKPEILSYIKVKDGVKIRIVE